jgi:hypothetical protein
MLIRAYVKGKLARIDILVKDIAGTLIDPTALDLRITKPSGAAVSRAWPTGPTITRDGLGTFHRDEDVDQAGRWYYSAISTGTGQDAQNGEFMVEASQ